MNKKIFIPIFVIVVAVLMGISVIPDFKKSQEPINVLKAMARQSGGIGIAQYTSNQSEYQKAIEEKSATVEKYGERTAYMVFKKEEEQKFLNRTKLDAPAYFIFDTDGNLPVAEKGILTFNELQSILGGLHTH
ncbi:hypothetical protein [Limisalsivibrio acetivorans]|uniref:hypothetical protein n=1 Tax=Limisalsivibrio acetivorans TaxID=1304888 RepID=UPI0003B63317|nr:hypothetical protein [Limisalsivibrio acetivorans]